MFSEFFRPNQSGLVTQTLFENRCIAVLVQHLQAKTAGEKPMEPGDLFIHAILTEIINQLQVEPRATILRQFFVERRSRQQIAASLNLSQANIDGHIEIFKGQLEELCDGLPIDALLNQLKQT